MRRLALLVETGGVLAVGASFFAGDARYIVIGAGAALLAAAAAIGVIAGSARERRALPAFWLGPRPYQDVR